MSMAVAQEHILLFILFHFSFNSDLPIFARVKFYEQVLYYLDTRMRIFLVTGSPKCEPWDAYDYP